MDGREPTCDPLSLQKDAVVLGTYETDAFILSLRRRDEFAATHSFGYHRIPHIGVYGMDYSLALPMTLLSLPPTPMYLEKLPQEILDSLGLGHLRGSFTGPPPPSPRHLLSQRIISTLHSHHNLPSELQLREIAREVVKFAIGSAICRLGPTNQLVHSLRVPVTNSLSVPCEEKRPSVVSMASVDSEEVEVTAPAHRQLKSVSIQIEGTVIEEVKFEEWTEEEEEEDEGEFEDDVLRKTAKKVVKKALHLACKRWESMNRRSSIDYLIASTKRLKIASPSPPPTLPEEQYEQIVGRDLPSSWTGSKVPSPSPDRSPGHGKKRNRSESHDVMMMKELERFRRAQNMGQEERVFAKPRNSAGRGNGPKRGGPPQLQQQESLGELISDIHRLSIQRMESESEDCYSSEDDYTVLSGVAKPAGSTSDGSIPTSPMPPPNSPTSLQVMRAGIVRSPSPLLHTVLPSALREIPRYSSSSEEENTTCTSPEFQQRLSSHSMATALSLTPHTQDPILFLPRDGPVPEMDYYIILHTHPPPGLCQKFFCNNTNEVNLIYHCWLFPDVPFEPEIVCSEQLEMGVFQPRGVVPVHQDLKDAGVAFSQLQPRSVIHC
jgi:hypothetical protein